jgi:hypothetical protein
MARTSVLCLCLSLLVLSACKGEEKAPAAGTAGGEILPASVSDAMLPLDTVRSQPPLAPRPSAAKEEAADEAGDEDKPGPASPQAPAPAATATPSAE